MKKILVIVKESKAGIFISFVLSFMLMFYEPLNLFVSSRNDFEFDIYSFFPFIILQTIILFLVLSFFFVITRLIHKNIYMFFIVCFIIGTLCTYIQGNFLAGSLPAIDGTFINFDTYKIEKIISMLLWIIVSVIILFILYKYKFEMIEKVIKYASIVIILMLSTSIISFFFSKNFFKNAKLYVSTTDYINQMSNDKNYIIFILDAVDSSTFNAEIEKLNMKEKVFKDFTYFPDTLGAYPYTRNSIPFILSGKWYENERDFSLYMTESIAHSPIINKLESDNYLLNFYEQDLAGYDGKNHERLRNIREVSSFDYKEMFNEELRIIMYKYLPYQLKWRAKIEKSNMSNIKSNKNIFKYNDVVNYNRFKNDKLEIIDDKNFQFIHLEGAHNPQRYDINLNIHENGTHEGNLDACVTILNTYLTKLRENNVYDNSVIVILSDHGFKPNAVGRQNPILYIKGINEQHEYKVSDKKVSYVDLQNAFINLADGKKSDELFENLDNEERRYLYYEYTKENYIIEMTLKGHAWELNNLKETGKKFIR